MGTRVPEKNRTKSCSHADVPSAPTKNAFDETKTLSPHLTNKRIVAFMGGLERPVTIG